MFTKRQKQVLDFIATYRKTHDISPSLEEIKKYLKISSVSTAHHHVKKLQEIGMLQKEYNQPRSVSLRNENKFINVPILGLITAGEPIEALEIPDETIAISKLDISIHGKHYALRVRGNSMIDEGIFDGDIVIVRKQEFADNGQTVVAIIDENEATLKKIYKEKNRIRLQPANHELFPIYRKDVEIRGVVVKIIRNLENQIEKEKVKDEKYLRKIDYSWDYRGEKTKTATHGLHSYPAMFIPQVARRLIENYSSKGQMICDIFCGSGTTLVESRLSGRNAYGIDLNPFAVFLANVKTTEIDPKKLTGEYFKIVNRINTSHHEINLPSFNNIGFWFKQNVIMKLAVIKHSIDQIEDEKIKNFFLVVLSDTVRSSSNTKNGEFKLVRIKPDKLVSYNPNVFEMFKKKAISNIAGMSEFYSKVDKNTWSRIIEGDSSKQSIIKNNSIDFILTSPPYGDSQTTVAYGQFSRLSAQWIDIFNDPNDASSVDKNLLGGIPVKELAHSLGSDYLAESFEKIKNKDVKRAKQVLSFYLGLNECLIEAHRILKKNKYFAIVIGNRMVKQVRIPTDFIIAELGEKIGFKCENIVVRNIPGKRMPNKNSPTNIVGVLEETMNKESIVILRKN